MLVDLMNFSSEAVGSLPKRAAPAGAKNSRKRMRIRASEMKKFKARPRIQQAFFTWLISEPSPPGIRPSYRRADGSLHRILIRRRQPCHIGPTEHQ